MWIDYMDNIYIYYNIALHNRAERINSTFNKTKGHALIKTIFSRI